MKSNLELMQNVVKPYIDAKNQALTNYVAENNVKNFCPTFPASGSAAGVDYTTAANGIVTAVGTSTGQTAFYSVNQVANVLPAGNYIASAGSDASENLRLVVLIKRANNSTVYIECTSAEDKPFTVYADDQFMSIYIRTNGGSTAINGTISPMIRDASITDPTYQPYAKTNVELTQALSSSTVIDSVIDTTSASGVSGVSASLERLTDINMGILFISFTTTADAGGGGLILGTLKSSCTPAHASCRAVVPLVNDSGGDVEGSLYLNSTSPVRVYKVTNGHKYYATIPIILA